MTHSFDDVCDLLEEWEASLPAAAYHQRIDDLLAELSPDAEVRAELLARSGAHRLDGFLITVDLAEAERRLRAAIDHGGPTVVDPRTDLVEVLRLTGRRTEFEELIRECLRAPSTVALVDTCSTLGEHLELAEELAHAHRAYTVGLKWFDPDVDVPESIDEEQCLSGRFRVRRYLGHAMDAYDHAYEELYPKPTKAIRKRLTT